MGGEAGGEEGTTEPVQRVLVLVQEVEDVACRACPCECTDDLTVVAIAHHVGQPLIVDRLRLVTHVADDVRNDLRILAVCPAVVPYGIRTLAVMPSPWGCMSYPLAWVLEVRHRPDSAERERCRPRRIASAATPAVRALVANRLGFCAWGRSSNDITSSKS